LQENNVQTKEDESRDVTHDVDDVLFHELAEILIHKLPYPFENENGSNATCKIDGEEMKFEKTSTSKDRSDSNCELNLNC